MRYDIPKADLPTMVTIMSDEVLRFINDIVANKTKDDPDAYNMYSSKKDIDMRQLSVTFGLHNAVTDTVVYKTYFLDTFAKICSEQTLIETTFNELTDYMLEQTKMFINKSIVLNAS